MVDLIVYNILDFINKWHFYKNFFSVEQQLPNIINSCIFIIKKKNKFIKLVSNTLYNKSKDRINQELQNI